MTLSERETRTQLIDPMLAAAGWSGPVVVEEYCYRPGRLRLLGEQTVRDEPQFIDYVLRAEPHGAILAALEAKDESHSPGAGLQQALAYATDVDAPFAFSSNGHEIVEQDMRTGQVRRLKEFPSHEELLTRWRAAVALRGTTVKNRHGVEVRNPQLQPAYSLPGAPPMRYYQERAVAAAIDPMLAGKRRALLSLATGTGKTLIAFHLVHKLLHTGYVKRVLFLADRISLRDQAYNEFGALGDRRGVVQSGELPLQRDVHFAIYQSMYAETSDGSHLFERYPRDYFDLIVIDECHRSGYGDWGSVLDHFSDAFHLGMTATPKQDDSIDTYAFFASENPDADGQPRPVYEYSLGRGIDDGFLATYKALRVRTSVDDALVIQDALEQGAELIVPEGTTARDVYDMREFEREIVVPDRTRVLCEHLAGVLRNYGALDKTIIFCVTMEHAELVRSEMQRLLGSETGKNLYAARIVSEERDAMQLLEQFQLASSSEPVVATTVDLLSTGVNAPSVRNIVFMKPIGSVTTFKQIIGRGSRIDPLTGKTFFRVIDYTNATRLFDEWDLPPRPVIEGPSTGEQAIAGAVVDSESRVPIASASISVRLTSRLLAEAQTDEQGEFAVQGLPGAVVDVFITARGYTRRQVRVDTTQDNAEAVVVGLSRPSEGARQVRISGVDVSIADEVQLDLGNGNALSASEYLDRVREVVTERVADIGELRAIWQSRDARQELEEHLAMRRVTPELLALVVGRSDVDGFDLIAHVAFSARMLSLDDRATGASAQLAAAYPELPDGFVAAVLDKFRLGGVNEVSSSEIFNLAPFHAMWGGVLRIVPLFGGAAGTAAFLAAVQTALFDVEKNG